MNAKAMGAREHEQQRPSSAAGSMISNDKNLMPSMVVRQQKSQLLAAESPSSSDQTANNFNHHHRLHPAVDQLETPTFELLNRTRRAAAGDQINCVARPHNFDQDGLILPRPVPHQHPQLLAPGDINTRQQANTIRDLNRELKFNQVRGKNVLDQKSELKRAMEKLDESRRKKEAEQERLTRRSSLELKLQERAERVARFETTERKSSSPGQGELVRAAPE